jgi:hypothetical protein
VADHVVEHAGVVGIVGAVLVPAGGVADVGDVGVVKIATTPGTARAVVVSIAVIRACGCGLVTSRSTRASAAG